MKIRQRTLLNNLTVGVLPILLISIIIAFVNSNQDKKYSQNTLINHTKHLQIYIEETLKTSQDHSAYIAQLDLSIKNHKSTSSQAFPTETSFMNRYKPRIFEVFVKNKPVHKNLLNKTDEIYTMPSELSRYIAEQIQKDKSAFPLSYPVILSNTLVVFNCTPLRSIKSGFVSFATPLDSVFLQDFNRNNNTGVYFIQNANSIIVSDEQYASPLLKAMIKEKFLQTEHNVISVKYKQEHLIIFRQELTRIKHIQEGRVISNSSSYIGTIINKRLINQEYFLFRQISFIILFASTLLVIILSVIYSRKLTDPIKELQQQISLFDKYREPMSPRSQAKDEIGDLHTSFSKLSSHILIKNAEIEDEKNKLHSQNKSMLADLEIARKIQNSLLPRISPSEQIYYYYKPMLQVGGDFFDFIDLPSGKVGFFISDVSGHGVPAALITAMLKSFILQNKNIADLPALFLLELNKFLWDQTGGNFVTALYGVFDPYLLTFNYANAGHEHPLIVRDHTIVSPVSNNRKPPLGIMNNQELSFGAREYQDFKIQLKGNDFLILYTDGLLEAVNYEKSRINPNTPLPEFGDISLCDSILKHSGQSNVDLVIGIINDLMLFRGNNEFDDDVCIICLKISDQQTPLNMENRPT